MLERQNSASTSSYEKLTRFIFDKRHFSRAKNITKPSAFLANDVELRCSAIWIDGLHEIEVWRIGDDFVGQARKKVAVARADFNASVVAELTLAIHPDPKPHPRHVEICGWPNEKDKRLSIAQGLCAKAALKIR